MRLVRIILIQAEVVSIDDHQLADEIRNPFFQVFLQKIASPGLRQQQHGLYYVRNVQHFGIG